MKTGIELIVQERQKQIDKYRFTGEHHANHPEWYEEGQLIYAAETLAYKNLELGDYDAPENWDQDWWERQVIKPYKERLIIAGALIAAEIDRLQRFGRREEDHD